MSKPFCFSSRLRRTVSRSSSVRGTWASALTSQGECGLLPCDEELVTMNSVGILFAQEFPPSCLCPDPIFNLSSGVIPSGLTFSPQPAGLGGGKLPRAHCDSNGVERGGGQLWNLNQVLLPSRVVLPTGNDSPGKPVPWTLLVFWSCYQSTIG